MARYWSDEDGCWFEGESIWNGRDPLPGLGAIERRSSYLVQTASTGADALEDKPAKRAARMCECGRKMLLVPHSEITQCGVCRGTDRHGSGKPRLCRGCEQWKTWGDQAKHSWCNDCKIRRRQAVA